MAFQCSNFISATLRAGFPHTQNSALLSGLERRTRLPLTHAQHTWTAITMAEVAEIKLFGKWTYEDVEVRTRSRPRAGRLTAGKSSSLSRVLASHAPAPSNQPLTGTPPSPHRSTTSLSRFVNTPRNVARARRATPPVAARADARDRPDPFARVYTGSGGFSAHRRRRARRRTDRLERARTPGTRRLPSGVVTLNHSRTRRVVIAAVGPRSGRGRPEAPSRDAPFRVTFPRVAATGFLRGARGIAVRRERRCTRGSFANRRVHRP